MEKLETIDELIDQVKRRYNVESDYRLSQLLGVTRSAIYNRKNRGSKLANDETAFQIAALLGLDPAYVLVCNAAQRAPNDRIRRIWSAIARGVPKTVSMLAFAFLAANLYGLSVTSLYIMSSYYARRRAGLDSPPGSVTEYARQENGKNVLLA